VTSRHRRATAAVAISISFAWAVAGCGGGSGADTMPDVTLDALDGSEPLDMGSLEGPAVVNLWATWCGPCREELPAFQAVDDGLDGSVRFIGINEGDAGEKAAAFLDEIDVTFEQYLDIDGLLSEELRISGLPATILVDENGDIAATHAGALDEDELYRLIEDELGLTR
jgi:cytochrome c biogenesis protein CcmG, thiol:disulfide interchange protein DsbE